MSGPIDIRVHFAHDILENWTHISMIDDLMKLYALSIIIGTNSRSYWF